MSGRTLITRANKIATKLEKKYDYRTKDKPDCIPFTFLQIHFSPVIFNNPGVIPIKAVAKPVSKEMVRS
jgi:hypothetical protein